MVAPSSRIRAKAKGWASGCCSEGTGTQVQDVDGAGRSDLDELVCQLGTSSRVPFHRRHEHLVAVADAQDAPLGQGGHERTDDRAQ